jgi:hypothetical protein
MALVLVEGEEEISRISGAAQAPTTSAITISASARQTGSAAHHRAAVALILLPVVMFILFP